MQSIINTENTLLNYLFIAISCEHFFKIDLYTNITYWLIDLKFKIKEILHFIQG